MIKMRNNDPTLVHIFILGLALWVWGHSPAVAAQKSNPYKAKESAMSLAANTLVAVHPKPSIDAAVPQVFETASFGLG